MRRSRRAPAVVPVVRSRVGGSTPGRMFAGWDGADGPGGAGGGRLAEVSRDALEPGGDLGIEHAQAVALAPFPIGDDAVTQRLALVDLLAQHQERVAVGRLMGGAPRSFPQRLAGLAEGAGGLGRIEAGGPTRSGGGLGGGRGWGGGGPRPPRA